MKKITLLLLLALTVFAPLATGMNSPVIQTRVSPNALTAGDTITVGFLSPQTGELSQYSEPFIHAAMLAGSQLNDTTDYTWVIKVYDTKTDPQASSAAMTQAVTDGAAYVAGAAGSSNTLAAAAIAKTEKVPLISYASTSPDLTTFNDGGYLWRVVPSDAFQGQADADIAIQAGFKTAVIVNLDNAYGKGIADKFDTAFTAGGGKILAKLPYASTKTDFSSEISTIQAQSPDLIFDVSYATDGSNLFTQLKDQNVNIPVLGTDGIADNAIFKEKTGTQDAMSGFVATKPTSIETTAVKDFNTAYAAAYPNETGIYTAESYDSVMAGAKAVMAADSTAGADIIAALANLDYAGASGQVKFDANGDVTGAVYDVLQVQGADGFVSIGQWNGGTLTYSNQTAADNFKPVVKSSSNTTAPLPFFSVLAGLTAVVAVFELRRRKNF